MSTLQTYYEKIVWTRFTCVLLRGETDFLFICENFDF